MVLISYSACLDNSLNTVNQQIHVRASRLFGPFAALWSSWYCLWSLGREGPLVSMDVFEVCFEDCDQTSDQ